LALGDWKNSVTCSWVVPLKSEVRNETLLLQILRWVECNCGCLHGEESDSGI
jgi:hypothetical protein